MLLAAGLPLNMDRQEETKTEVVRLYEVEGWTMQEIADHYGWTVSNVSQRLRRSGVHARARWAA
jgi:DNA-directed RNA polymerase specialized sigma24 family protein